MNQPPSRANGSHITLLSVDQPRCAKNATGNPTQRDKMVLPSPVASAFPRILSHHQNGRQKTSAAISNDFDGAVSLLLYVSINNLNCTCLIGTSPFYYHLGFIGV